MPEMQGATNTTALIAPFRVVLLSLTAVIGLIGLQAGSTAH